MVIAREIAFVGCLKNKNAPDAIILPCTAGKDAGFTSRLGLP